MGHMGTLKYVSVWGHLRARNTLIDKIEKHYDKHEQELNDVDIFSIPQLTAFILNEYMEKNK
mgnify:CR=1 FL=1